jgi:hypothetical protein
MKWFLFFLTYTAVISCNQNNGIVTSSQKDTLSPLYDTTIVAYTSASRSEDSLDAIKKRDSFYSIRPIQIFISDKKADCWSKLKASFIDTTLVKITSIKVSYKEFTTFDKEQIPVAKQYAFTSNEFSVKLKDNCYGDYYPREFYINNKKMQPPVDLDTSISGNWFITNIMLTETEFYKMKIAHRNFYMAKGYVEKCNGTACGVLYFLLYDADNKKTIIFHQFRDEELRIGYDLKTGNIELMATRDMEYIDTWQCITYSGNVFSIAPNGKVVSKKGKNGKPVCFAGYSTFSGVDSLNVTDANY